MRPDSSAGVLDGITAADLPPCPFEMSPWIVCVDADKMLDKLRAELADPECPRKKNGALQADIRDVVKLWNCENIKRKRSAEF